MTTYEYVWQDQSQEGFTENWNYFKKQKTVWTEPAEFFWIGVCNFTSHILQDGPQ